MLKSEKFFGKSDTATTEPRLSDLLPERAFSSSSNGLAIASPLAGQAMARVVPASITNPVSSNNSFSTPAAVGANEMRSKLTVGPNIKLKGVEITDCDTLVVEGRVEASIDSRVIQISEKGAFIGNAEFDIAEIRGEFDGELTVRQKLVVYSSGRVTGKIRYGKLVIEEGGQVSGDIQLSTSLSKGITVSLSA
jgi:cytoskeletal protein CcmA (bactofilin family)